MTRSKLALILPLILVTFVLLAVPVHAQHDGGWMGGRITVSGEGVISTTPDMATVQFGVVSRQDNPEEARAMNATAAAAALNAVREMGIDEKDIQMQNLQINPMREYDPDRRMYEEKGWEAVRNLSVTVRDLDDLPALIEAIVSNGGNRMNSIQYGLDDRDEIELEVLKLAVKRAREKAAVMAGALDKQVAALAEMNEHGVSVPRPVLRMEAAYDGISSKAAPEPDAYASGQIEVRTSVTAVFILK